jgi:TolB-like protein
MLPLEMAGVIYGSIQRSNFMKNTKMVYSIITVLVLLGILNSCVSLEDRTLTYQERQETEIIGNVSTTFTAFQFFYIPNKTNLKNKAYASLKKLADQKYGGNIDVVNVTISGGFSGYEIINIGTAAALGAVGIVFISSTTNPDSYLDANDPDYTNKMIDYKSNTGLGAGLLGGAAIPLLIGNSQKITATGDVVKLSAEAGAKQAIQNRMQETMASISDQLIETLPQKSTIAVLSIGSNDGALSETAIEELEFNLVDSRKFTIVDRARLDQIRREQNFQLSGEVSDDSAVSIGNMLGANIVLVGAISTTGSRGRITVRALDVQSAQIVAMARENF